MKFTFNWLKEHLEGDYTLNDVVLALTDLGLEVESVTDLGASLKAFTVAHILSTEKHPDADRLKVCRVQIEEGKDPIQVVCGAPNAREDLKVIFAAPGVVIPSSGKELKTGMIRGIESQGMLCSGAELLLTQESDGIMELPPLAKIGDKIVDVLGLSDPVIDIAITPNRGDCLGVRGIARDLAAKGIGTLKALPGVKVPASFDSNITVDLALNENHQEDCPVFLSRVIRGVKNGPSPLWLKQRLEAVGQNSISLLVDLSNYFMLEFNRPSHFFDLNALKGNLRVKHANAGDVFVALKGVEYILPQNAAVIEDDEGLLSLAGIKGGDRGSIQNDTTDILVETAHFAQDSMAQTGRSLGLLSDARYRFERYVDPHQLHDLMERLTAFVIQHAGGTASEVKTHGALPPLPQNIIFDTDLIPKLTGVFVNIPHVISILERLGCKIQQKDKTLHVTPPTWRSDLKLPQDLVEEILRIEGYDKLNVFSLPISTQSTKGLEKLKADHLSRLRHGLCAQGYLETLTFSFMHSEKAKFFGIDLETSDLFLKNPISSELDIMRPSILPNLLDAVSANQARSHLRGAFFEIGPQYANSEPSGQKTMISGLKYGLAQEKEWFSPARNLDIYDIRSDLDFIFQGTSFTIKPGAPHWYHPGRSGTLEMKGKVLGYFGEIHPQILKAFSIKGTVVAFEVFHETLKISKPKSIYQKSIYQSVARDFAFVIQKDLTAETLINVIESAKISAITQVKLFDVFELPNNQKSIALRVTFESFDHTFEEKEIEDISLKVTTLIQEKTGGILRR